MADHVDITLASGKSVKVDTSDPEHTVGDARRQLGHALGVPPACLVILYAGGLLPQDADGICSLRNGDTCVILNDRLQEFLEQHIADEFYSPSLADLAGRHPRTMYLARRRLFGLPDSFGQLVSLQKLTLHENPLVLVLLLVLVFVLVLAFVVVVVVV